jgi:hypothetical protein
MTEQEAIAMLRALGYRVTKTKPKTVKKNRVGPTFVAKFADGQVTRMSIWTTLDNLDYERGVRMSQAAYESRMRQKHGPRKRFATPIVSAHFEQDGETLATYGQEQLAA